MSVSINNFVFVKQDSFLISSILNPCIENWQPAFVSTFRFVRFLPSKCTCCFQNYQLDFSIKVLIENVPLDNGYSKMLYSVLFFYNIILIDRTCHCQCMILYDTKTLFFQKYWLHFFIKETIEKFLLGNSFRICTIVFDFMQRELGCLELPTCPYAYGFFQFLTHSTPKLPTGLFHQGLMDILLYVDS